MDLVKVPSLKELTSLYIVSYLHFLNSNNILTLFKLLPLLNLRLIWRNLYFPWFLPARFTRLCVSLRNKNKCNPSIWSPLRYFSFKSFKDPNYSSFIRFQCILHDSEVIFSDFPNSHKSKRGPLISWEQLILQKRWNIWSPFCISILKVLRTQILRHSLDLKAFCIIQENLSQTYQISPN